MVRISWLSLLLARLARAIAHGSLLLAIAPQRVAVGDLVFSACLAEGCGFATVDGVRGRDAVTPGRCRSYSVQGWQATRSAPMKSKAVSRSGIFPFLGPGHRSIRRTRQLYWLLRGLS